MRRIVTVAFLRRVEIFLLTYLLTYLIDAGVDMERQNCKIVRNFEYKRPARAYALCNS